jgi:hypothetical protein
MDDDPETLADYVLRNAASLGLDEQTIRELREWLVDGLTRSERARQYVQQWRAEPE